MQHPASRIVALFLSVLLVTGAVVVASAGNLQPAVTPPTQLPDGASGTGQTLSSFLSARATGAGGQLAIGGLDNRGPQPLPEAEKTNYAAGEILVRFQDKTPQAERLSVLQEHDCSVLGELLSGGVLRVQVPQGQELESISTLRKDPSVVYAEPNYVRSRETTEGSLRLGSALAAAGLELTPNDTYYNTYQWNLRKISGPQAWDITTGSDSVILAVVDTGLDIGHPEFVCANKIAAGYNFVSNSTNTQDDNGYGTILAGIAGACSNNSTGIAAVNWNVKIMPVKVFDSQGSTTSSTLANGIAWAAANGAKVILMGAWGISPSQTESDAITAAYNQGVLIVSSAGDGYQTGNAATYPGAYQHVVAVAATGDLDEHAFYSNTGDYVDISAPGGDPTSSSDTNVNHFVASTVWRGTGYAYTLAAGTDFAAAHVAGLAAMLRGRNSSLSPDQVQAIMQNTAVDLGSAGRDSTFGYGRINMAAAVAATSGGPTPTATATVPAGSTPTATATAPAGFTPTATATAISSGGWVTIKEETFEGNFPGDWILNTGAYTWGKRTCRANDGSNSGWAIGGGSSGSALSCGSSYPSSLITAMLYGPFSLAGADAADLNLKAWVNTEAGHDALCWAASTSSDPATFDGPCLSGPGRAWSNATLDLSNVPTNGNLIGQPNVWIAFFFITDSAVSNTEGGYIDNIVLRKHIPGAAGTLTPTRTATVTSTRTQTTVVATATATPPTAATSTATPTTTGGSSAGISVEPAGTNVRLPSAPITVTITVQNVTNLGGFQFDLGFDPGVISVTNVTLASFPASTGRTVVPLAATIMANRISFGAFSFGSQAGPSGSGSVAVVTIQPLAVGSSSLHLDNVRLVDVGGATMPVTPHDGSVTVRSCLFGDFNCDCVVDIVDLQMAAAHWGTTSASPNWDARFDVDNNGRVDIVDLQLVAAAWGTHCASSSTSPSLRTKSIEAGGSLTVALAPPDSRAPLSGGAITVTVTVSNVNNLGGFQFDLGFNPAVISVTNVALAGFPAASGRTFMALPPTIGQDRVTFGAFSFGSEPGVSGSGPLAVISIQPVAPGTTPLLLENVSIVDAAGITAQAAVTSGSIAVTNSTRVSAPIILSTFP